MKRQALLNFLMTQRLILIGSTILGTCLVINPAQSQVLSDGTTDTSVLGNCKTSCDVTGGAVAGQNLFHSFQEFNIPSEASVYFNDPGIANIFSRITGNNPSEIFGTLGVKGGDANLFLLNPNGIMFGEGATLDLNGSFFATTADEIQLGDRNFSAIPIETENLALLTVNPSALLFTQMNQAGAIVLEGAKLTSTTGDNISLLGQGDNNPGVEIKNSTINVTEGNISLGAVNSNGSIELREGWQLKFSQNDVLGDIAIADGSQISTSNFNNLANTAIKIDANNLKIGEGSKISTSTTGIEKNIKGANIAIDARTSVTITGEDSNGFQTFIAENLALGGNANLSNGLETTTLGTGNAGKIEITTPDLAIENGTGITSTTRSEGNSGNIELKISDTFKLNSSGLLTGSGTFSSGNVGEINIQTKQLSIEQKSVISSSTLGEGDAGQLSINAAEIIEIKDTPANSFIPTGVFTNTVFGDGNGGNLTIATPKLILSNGGQLSASSGAIINIDGELNFISLGGKGGDIKLAIADSLEVKGKSADGKFFSGILSNTMGDSSAGNAIVNTEKLSVSNNGEINLNSSGKGAAGTLEVFADSIVLDNRSSLNSTTRSGRGGNISLKIKDILRLKNNSEIDTNALEIGDGGNIDIAASFVVASVNSAISANAAVEAGNGGKITITANDVFLAADSRITADSASGIDGTVNIKTLVDAERHNEAKLSQKVIRADNKITRSCSSNSERHGTFTYTGKGGLPYNPLNDLQIGDVLLADLDAPILANDNRFVAQNPTLDIMAPMLVEAERWQINDRGLVELVAQTNSGLITEFEPINCLTSDYK